MLHLHFLAHQFTWKKTNVIYFILFDKIIYLYIWVLIINAVVSWLIAFNVLNT